MEEKLERIYGYLGIDTRPTNAEGVEKIGLCGYPHDKEPHTMWYVFGSSKIAFNKFLTYDIPTFEGQNGSPIIKKEGNN